MAVIGEAPVDTVTPGLPVTPGRLREACVLKVDVTDQEEARQWSHMDIYIYIYNIYIITDTTYYI